MTAVLTPGLAVPPLVVEIGREDLIRYAGAADDYVALHWDRPFMLEQGFDDVVVHGWLTFAHMARAVTDWLPPPVWQVTSYAVRYLRPTYPGTITCGGSVLSVAGTEAELELWARDSNATLTTTAAINVART